jgi:hypothetical protein
LIDHYDPELPARMADLIDPSLRSVILDPMRSAWYPEAALQQFMRAFDELITRGDRRRLVAVFEECTLQGVHRFFQALLRLTTPDFLLKKTPVLWNFVRRNCGFVTVEADVNGAIVRYREFPYFDDRNYQLLALGTLRPLATLCGGTNPRADILDVGKDWLDVEIRFHGGPRGEPTGSSGRPPRLTDTNPGGRGPSIGSLAPERSSEPTAGAADSGASLSPSSSWRARNPSSRDS